MVYLKTYYHPDKVSDPITELKIFQTDDQAIAYMQDQAKTYGLGGAPDRSIHYFEFLSKEDFERGSCE